MAKSVMAHNGLVCVRLRLNRRVVMPRIRPLMLLLIVCSVMFIGMAPVAHAAPRTTPRDVIDMTVGDNACAVLRNGTAWCWGNGGRATQVMTNIGLPLTNVKAIEENPNEYWFTHTCAIAGIANNVWCWGDNGYGQLGDQSYTDRPNAVIVYKSGGGLLKGITHITLGQTHTCGIDTNREVWCWGDNDRAQLGIQSTVSTVNIATKVRTSSGGILRGVKNIVSTYYNTCAHLTNGQVWCWGDVGSCIIACLSSWYYNHYYAATNHPYANGAQTIYAGYENMCALMSGRLRCWGANGSGQLANWSTSSTNYPTFAQMGDGQYMIGGITDVSIGEDFICAVRFTMVYCAGSNSYNKSGSGLNWYGDCYWYCATQYAYLPLRTAEGNDVLDNVANLESGEYSSCFVARNGSVWCWGSGWTDRKPTRVQFADGTYMGS